MTLSFLKLSIDLYFEFQFIIEIWRYAIVYCDEMASSDVMSPSVTSCRPLRAHTCTPVNTGSFLYCF